MEVCWHVLVKSSLSQFNRKSDKKNFKTLSSTEAFHCLVTFTNDHIIPPLPQHLLLSLSASSTKVSIPKSNNNVYQN